jgi:ElaB/YqjD/DUF883 family membrane-anchored ribosome-binding protein
MENIERPMATGFETAWPGEEPARGGDRGGRVTDIAAARARSFVSSAREGAEQAAGYVQGAMQQARDKMAKYREGGFEKVRDDAIRYTREEPVTALLIAAGIGLLIGSLTALRRR